MSISPNSTLLRNCRIEDLIAYLKLTNWKLADSSNDRWLIFKGASDINGDPLEIVLPANPNARDTSVYLASAINLLSALSEDYPESIIKKISLYDSDVLSVRNVETDSNDSIILDLAYNQVKQLRQLIAYSACSEQDPRPNFTAANLLIAKRMVKHYHFGHTFSGSFGFTIKSQIIRQSYKYQQLPLFPPNPSDEEVVMLPIERRVMERIIRGLLAVKQATKDKDLQQLIQQYPGGLNSNMCKALVYMSRSKSAPLEYSILWSPKVAPSDDVRNSESIILTETSYQYLEEASHKLSVLKPEQVTVRGQIISLSSKDNPQQIDFGDPQSRSTVIKWKDRPGQKRPTNVVVFLAKEDYLAAIEAHKNWSTVEISGAIQKVGSVWRLSTPHDFKIIDKK